MKNTGEEQWWFQDMEKKVFGPYSRNDMRAWYVGGYLALQLLVTTDPTKGFSKISDLFPDTTLIFLIEPVSQDNDDTPHWFFLDRAKLVQGPFSNKQMDEWFRKDYFEGTLMIFDNALPEAIYGWRMLQEYFPNYLQEPPFMNSPQQIPPQVQNAPVKGTPNLNDRLEFPMSVPLPPRFEGVKKIYPSEQSTPLLPLELIDIFGNNV